MKKIKGKNFKRPIKFLILNFKMNNLPLDFIKNKETLVNNIKGICNLILLDFTEYIKYILI